MPSKLSLPRQGLRNLVWVGSRVIRDRVNRVSLYFLFVLAPFAANDNNDNDWANTAGFSPSIMCIRVVGFWRLNAVSKSMLVSFYARVRPKSVFLQTMYLDCVWKWIRSREQNSAPESRRVSLHYVKVIKCQG